MLATIVWQGRHLLTLDYLKQPQTTFFTFLSYWTKSNLYLILEELNWINKNWIKKLCKSHLKINYVEFPYAHKNSRVQAFTFINSKVVYFKKHLISSTGTQETKFPLPLNVSYHGQTIVLGVGAMTEPLYTYL